MILLTLAGYAVARWGGVPSGTAIGLLAGFVVAPFVPLPGSRRASAVDTENGTDAR